MESMPGLHCQPRGWFSVRLQPSARRWLWMWHTAGEALGHIPEVLSSHWSWSRW